MKTTELEGALLDYHTARAEGVPAGELELRANGTLCVRNMPVVGLVMPLVLVLDYRTNWALCGPLVEKYKIFLDVDMDDGEWVAGVGNGLDGPYSYSRDPKIAICRDVVRAAFGEEVEDLP